VNDLGEFLRRERELRRITLEDVAENTKISRRYLEAIEEDQYDRLPGEAFVRGFIRSYVKYIGLDPTETMLMYDQARSAQAVVPPRTIPRAAGRRASSPRPLLWLLVLGLVVVGGGLFGLVTVLKSPRSSEPTLFSRTERSTLAKGTSPLVLTAIADSDTWLHVTIDGKEENDVLLRAGQSIKWVGQERFVLSIGNARATRLKLNERELAIPLPPQNILRAYTVARDMLQ
jgi:cytoskeletal protein RodZ